MKQKLYLLLSISFSIYYALTIAEAGRNVCLQHTADIVAGREFSPFVYRLLTPVLLVAAGNTAVVHLAFLALMTALFLALLDAYFAYWRMPPVWLVLVALMLPMTFQAWYCSQYEMTEVVLLLCGLFLLTRHWSSSAHSTGK